MTKIEIAKEYIDYLSGGNVEKIIRLFAKNGKVTSPIYGTLIADKFYKILNDDTVNSQLEIKGIFEDSDTGKLALYFDYKWTLKTGKIVVFEVVDIIEFDDQNKIISLTIIYDTVISRKKMEELNAIKTVDYIPKYQHAFRALNKEWIDKYFEMEAADYKALDYPEENILAPGGAILVALYNEEIAGVCALIKMDGIRYDYELAKMAVAPKFHGKGIGYFLGKAVIEKAKKLKGKSIFIESNTILTPAINLYRKLGFTEVEGLVTPYERSNIQMELIL